MFQALYSVLARCARDYQALVFIALLAACSRLLPHPDNFTPLAAIGLFAGCYVNQRLYLLVPVVAALLSDLLGPGIYNLFVMLLVYIGLALPSLAGRLLLRGRRVWSRLPLAVLAGAVGFFLVSNLGPWWLYYPHSLTGLLECYSAGLPYLLRTLLGDGLYALLFFGTYEFWLAMQRRGHYA